MEDKVIVKNANLTDRDKIIDFIRDNWFIKDHIFTRNREFFDHCHIVDDKLCFAIGEDSITKKIYGICGYILNNKTDNPDVCTCIYRTIKSPNAMLGVDLINFIKDNTKARTFFCTGIVKNTIPIYKFLGYKTGKLQHYYKLGKKSDFKVAFINHAEFITPKEGQRVLKRMDTFEELKKVFKFDDYKHVRPYKDEWCVEYRYYKNIGYEYDVYGIFNENNECNAFIVFREIEQNGVKVAKIIDYVGDDKELSFCGEAIDNLIKEKDYEYVDFYEHGIDDEIMNDAGFVLLTDDDENIIPHYFEPFEQKNIDIYYFTDNDDNFHAFRTDAGQDRPNNI